MGTLHSQIQNHGFFFLTKSEYLSASTRLGKGFAVLVETLQLIQHDQAGCSPSAEIANECQEVLPSFLAPSLLPLQHPMPLLAGLPCQNTEQADMHTIKKQRIQTFLVDRVIYFLLLYCINNHHVLSSSEFFSCE